MNAHTPTPTVVRSTYDNQLDVIDAIVALHAPDGFDCDLTFGGGMFWKRHPRPKFCYDLDPQQPGVVEACSMDIPHDDGVLGNIMFDPPFLTYVREKRSGNGAMVMSKRFSGYWRYDELAAHYSATFAEAFRVMRRGAVLAVKCQDIVHNHSLHPTHINAVGWAANAGFRLKDLFVLTASHRMPSPNRKGAQKHSRIFHSYFLVFVKP